MEATLTKNKKKTWKQELEGEKKRLSKNSGGTDPWARRIGHGKIVILRVMWHPAHQKNCPYRPIAGKFALGMKERGIKF